MILDIISDEAEKEAGFVTGFFFAFTQHKKLEQAPKR